MIVKQKIKNEIKRVSVKSVVSMKRKPYINVLRITFVAQVYRRLTKFGKLIAFFVSLMYVNIA